MIERRRCPVLNVEARIAFLEWWAREVEIHLLQNKVLGRRWREQRTLYLFVEGFPSDVARHR